MDRNNWQIKIFNGWAEIAHLISFQETDLGWASPIGTELSTGKICDKGV
ncbi:hypothetical protein [Desulfotalea psychrophila]|nr:hypothetical protein [Desulfotalea psychrophila]